jgi:hypothetical protein
MNPIVWHYTYSHHIEEILVNRNILTHYARLVRLTGMSSKTDRIIRQAAQHQGGNPNRWWGTLNPVPASQWVTFEVLEGDIWVDALAYMEARTKGVR